MKKHVMFVSLPLRGHANQMIALAQELVYRGNQVSFVISEAGEEWIANTGAHFIRWEPRIEPIVTAKAVTPLCEAQLPSHPSKSQIELFVYEFDSLTMTISVLFY